MAAAGGRISIFASPELQALRQRLAGVESEVRSQINRQTKAVAGPVWKRALGERVHTRRDAKVLVDTASVAVTPRQLTLRSATSVKRLKGGLSPKTQYGAVEFGVADPKGYVRQYTESKSRHGHAYVIKGRHTRRQLPPRYAKGRVVYPAAAKVIPRIASLWVQTAMRTLGDLIDG